VKRTRREGAWEYPIPPSQIPDPEDFGFAFFETRPLDEAERQVLAQHDIGIFHYIEPWLVWRGWGDSPNPPPIEERVAVLQSWASGEGEVYAAWRSAGGIADSGHLLLGNGVSTGVGMATPSSFPVPPGSRLRIAWQARCASTETTQILCLRLFDAAGEDITASTPAPPGWFWSSTSQAHVIAGLTCSTPDTWEPFERFHTLPPGAEAARLSLRHWTGGDHFVHIDDLRVEDAPTGQTHLALDFDENDSSWTTAHNADWDGASPSNILWNRAPRHWTAQAILNSSPHDAEGLPLIDLHPYIWHEWTTGVWSQGWPVNSDPDLPSPNTFELFRDYWVLDRLEETAGVYIDSVNATVPVGGWWNHRLEHLAVTDSPLTYALADGAPLQLAPQSHAEFLQPISDEIRAGGRLMMVNLFAEAMRFHAHQADIMGSEVSHLVESDTRSRLRRTLAATRIVSNLLQYNWDREYATHEEMETFIRGQLFWGFYPAVSSAGGPLTGGVPDRYFLHPELYERDRPLFQRYIPVIRELSTAGWEPITHATAGTTAEIERFGDFRRGPVSLTVRGQGGEPLDTVVTLDLESSGLGLAPQSVEVRDLLNDRLIPAELISDGSQIRFALSLGGGEVGAYRVDAETGAAMLLR
jgi:hypothetical protein